MKQPDPPIPPSDDFLTPHPEGTCLAVRLIPGARSNQLDGVLGDALKIRIQSPPVEGKANRQLILYLSKLLGISKQRIQLVAGEKSRHKKILIKGLDPEAVMQKLVFDA